VNTIIWMFSSSVCCDSKPDLRQKGERSIISVRKKQKEEREERSSLSVYCT
jgi:hypothetical protein